MKKLVVMAVTAMAALSIFAAAAKMSLADARAKIGEVIKDPAKMTEIMKSLAAEDQPKFLAEVNAAIEAMPVSNEEKVATVLNVDSAAVKGSKGNVINVLAEVYATAPLEALTVINERFAADLFNRAADPTVTYTDEQLINIGKKVMEVVNERNKSAENAAVRSTFAILMMTRATNNSISGYSDMLVETLPQEMQATAKNEWIPQALGEGVNVKTYEPMLGGIDSVPVINEVIIMRLAGPQLLESMLGDVVEGTPLVNTYIATEAQAMNAGDPVLVTDDINQGVTATTEPGGYPGQSAW